MELMYLSNWHIFGECSSEKTSKIKQHLVKLRQNLVMRFLSHAVEQCSAEKSTPGMQNDCVLTLYR